MVRFFARCIAAAAALAVVVQSFPTHICATNAPPQRQLGMYSTELEVGPSPWGVAYFNETLAIVAVNFSMGVLDLTSPMQPKLTVLIPMPPKYFEIMNNANDTLDTLGYGYRELVISHNKLNVYVATGNGAMIYDVGRLLAGRDDAIVGVLSSDGLNGHAAISLSITPDDGTVFISQEFGSNNTYNYGAIEVFNVTRLANGTVASGWRGFITLGYATIGQQFSEDYTKLFVTSELSNTATSANQTTGIISVLDVAKLKTRPGKSLVTRVPSGCHPVRAQMSTDKTKLWVALRDTNQVMAYDAVKLANNITDGVNLATVNVGTSPIGMAAIGDYILAADSNRFMYPNASTGVTVINEVGTLTKSRVNWPQIPSGPFTRSLAVSPSGNYLLVSQFNASSIRMVNITALNTPTSELSLELSEDEVVTEAGMA